MNSRIKSFSAALHGIKSAILNEVNFRIEITAALLAITAAIFLEFNKIEWSILFLTIGLVVVTEILNTAIEAIGDRINSEQDELIGLAKDFGAGAVLTSALISLLVAGVLFLPKILEILPF